MLVAAVKALREKNSCAFEAAEPCAHYLMNRLWVELAYLAATTNQPGWMNKDSLALYVASLTTPFDPALAPELLLASKVIEPQGDGYNCDRFARLNAHLSGDFIPSHKRGAAISALVRSKNAIAADAQHTLMLFPGEIVKDRASNAVDSVTAQRMMVCIKTLDNVLQRKRGREQNEYGEGLIADAIDAVRKYNDTQLRRFYEWLLEHRGRAGTPETAELLLARFDEFTREAMR